MKPGELLALLRDIYLEKLALFVRHRAGARLMRGYDVNNTYQYTLAREETHLAWIRDAIEGAGGRVPSAEEIPPPEIPLAPGSEDATTSVLQTDLALARAFVDRWRPRVERISHNRHRRMLGVILDETEEHIRFFEQALAGRTDLLGRRAEGAGTGGGVLPTRWLE